VFVGLKILVANRVVVQMGLLLSEGPVAKKMSFKELCMATVAKFAAGAKVRIAQDLESPSSKATLNE
jgi:hypothetical protein